MRSIQWLLMTCVASGAMACSEDESPQAGAPPNVGGSDAGAAEGGAGEGAGPAQGGMGGEGGAQTFGQCGPGRYSELRNVYWGDLHVHSSYSVDSFAIANRNDPTAAYAYARGETSLPIAEADGAGAVAPLSRALDFTAITDHSEFFTITGQCQLGAVGNEDVCSDINDQGSAQQAAQVAALGARLLAADPPGLPGCLGPQGMQECLVAAQTTWQKTLQAAAAANDPCSFTSLVAYEWTANTLGANLHRNVVFASDSVPDVPLDYINYPSSLELWQALDATCKERDGCDVITIPHNSNYSLGTMWDTADDPVARSFMARYQTLTEVTQHKAASECLPGAALADDDCDFEAMTGQDPDTAGPGYIRNGLGRGLMLEESTGENPIALGFVGATDTHNGTPGAVSETAWNGHLANTEDTAEDRLDNAATRNPGGITAVWARENTREEIFAALKRRETYATSGTRIVARFYVLDDVSDAQAAGLCADPGFPAALIAAGALPMGSHVSGLTRPTLFVAGAADVTPLERVDIIRLGLDGAAEPTMTRFSIDLQADERGTFCRSFREDAAFDSAKPWLYYARVFEQESPRWVQTDCAALPGHAACSDPAIAKTVRERAWTSPIFVSP